MTTLDAKAGLKSPSMESEKTQATAVEPVADTTTLITEQQVLFGSAAALAPAKTHRWSNPAHGAVAAVRAMFAKPRGRECGSTTRSGSITWRVHSCRARWTGCNTGQLASGTGFTTSEYCEASPTTARLGVPLMSTGMSPANVTRLRWRYWSS